MLLRQQLLSAIDCAVPQDQAIYISIPITTGINFLQWYESRGRHMRPSDYSLAHKSEVILPNIEKAAMDIRVMRDRHRDRILIEPTSLEIETWSQEDYLDFWGSVIDRFINLVYFSAGWNYSRGCAYEFLKASQKNIETLDLSGKPITISEGILLIKKASDDYTALGLESKFLLNIIAQLLSLSAAHEQPPL